MTPLQKRDRSADTGTVLIVDDERTVLLMQAAAVRQFGFGVQTAENAEDALKLLRKDRFNLVISDVHMPGESGFDFVEALVASAGDRTPVLFATGFDDVKTVRAGLAAGGDDFIGKGASIQDMRHRIAFWMACGLKALPTAARRRAIARLDGEDGRRFQSIRGDLGFNPDLFASVVGMLRAELDASDPTYGLRLIERVALTARATGLFMARSKSAGDFMRIPDLLYGALKALDRPWVHEIPALLNEYDFWVDDPRFDAFASRPLSAVISYDLRAAS